jgi:hypothetical protein
MKLDPGIHIVKHLVFFGKSGVTRWNFVCVQADYMADDADDQTPDGFLEVYMLWMFGWVLFCESAGDSVSRWMIPWAKRIADAPLEQLPQISRGNTVLAATYRGLCSVVTRLASMEAILLRCPLLLQMWIHERFDIGPGSSRRRRTRTSLVRSTGWSMPRSGGRRTLLSWSLPAHHRGSRPCAPETRHTG